MKAVLALLALSTFLALNLLMQVLLRGPVAAVSVPPSGEGSATEPRFFRAPRFRLAESGKLKAES